MKKKNKKKGKKTGMFTLLCAAVFAASFAGSALFRIKHKPAGMEKYSVDWSDEVGTLYSDLSYGGENANKFDLYVPADTAKERYSLVVYLHAGGFTSGDKAGDSEMLQWLCSKGYVAAGINYTLRDEAHPEASVYTQSLEIRAAIPAVVEAAGEKGYNIDSMAISGGSAGGALAMIYAYRDAGTSPVPVKVLFEAVGPSSFYPQDWKCYGFDREENKENAAGLFSVMAGKEITSDLFGTDEYDGQMRDISALLWIDGDTVPSVLAYGKYDRVQPYESSVRLDQRLTEYGIPHEYIVFPHSGHGLQNDTKLYLKYMEMVAAYLDTYLPVE